MTKALAHFLPNTDLNLQSLREVVQALEAGQPVPGAAAAAAGVTEASPAAQTPYKCSLTMPLAMSASLSASLSMPLDLPLTAPPSEGSTSSSGDSIVAGERDSRPTPASTMGEIGMAKVDDTIATAAEDFDTSINEINELHDELGWLRVDQRGTYRHVGAWSGYGFHVAVRSLCQRRCSSNAPPVKIDTMVPPFTLTPPLPPPPSSSSTADVAMGVSPQLMVASGGSTGRRQIFLPRRDLCNRCVSRFLRDIQAVYWFWSAERFYAVLDRLYAGDPASATPAVLCSLYAILALTCESEARQAALGSGGVDPSNVASATSSSLPPPPAARYLALAKGLVGALCDEADTDSVRALCLLALALQSNMCSNTAYVYIGAAARIALTLGLNQQRAIEPRGCLQQQTDLRLYATLFLLDLDVALCYGNPPAIGDEQFGGGNGSNNDKDRNNTSGGGMLDLAEQILSPGSHMPLDYLTVSCELANIRRRLSKLLYVRGTGEAAATTGGFASTRTTAKTARKFATGFATGNGSFTAAASPPDSSPQSHSTYASSPPTSSTLSTKTPSSASSTPSIADVGDALATLRAWYAAIPPHLRDVSRAAHFHQRSVAVLHLRYWSATIFATRPFLLYSVLHADAFAALPTAKRASFEAFCATCLDAAEQSLAVFSLMQDAGLQSSLITLDAACIFEVLQVFLLALARAGSGSDTAAAVADADRVRACLRTLQGMEQIFWTSHALVEVMAQLDETGLLNGDSGFSPPQHGETPGNFFLDIQQQQKQQQQQQQQQQFVSEVMEAYFSDLQNPFFDVNDDGSASMLSDHFHDSVHGGLIM